MPAKPVWYGRLDQAIEKLKGLPRPFVDRATIEFLLGVGPRRAQQIMRPCITERVGTSSLADRDQIIEHLQRIAAGDTNYYERNRRRKVVELIEHLRQERIRQPQLLVEAPVSAVTKEIDDLPTGVHLAPGRIVVEFSSHIEALEKLLALAMAISNDLERFEMLTK